MNELENEERRLLRSARRALSPTPSDADRVLRAVEHQLGTIAAASPSLDQVAAPQAATKASLGTVAKLLGALALTGGGAALIHGAIPGETASSSRRTAEPSAASTVEVAPERAEDDAPPEERRPARPAQTEPAQRSAPKSAVPPRALGRQRATERVTLRAELEALGRVERALRERDPARALALLDELERSGPSEHLAEERAAARLIARCALGRARPAERRAFATRSPRSAYAARIDEACAGPAHERHAEGE